MGIVSRRTLLAAAPVVAGVLALGSVAHGDVGEPDKRELAAFYAAKLAETLAMISPGEWAHSIDMDQGFVLFNRRV